MSIIGRLIDRYGYSTYGGNSHLIADRNEGWVMIQAAGGKGNYQRSRDFIGSDNLFSFAEAGLVRPRQQRDLQLPRGLW